MSIVKKKLGSFDPPCGSHLGFVHTFLVSGVSRRNILINFIEIAHTARTYYSKVRNRATFVMLKPHFEPNCAFCDTSMTFCTHLV